jgi:hypothetical protein
MYEIEFKRDELRALYKIDRMVRLDIPREGYEPAVYFLIRDEKVVYVGKALYPALRNVEHKHGLSGTTKKVFDWMLLRPCKEHELTQLEEYYKYLLEWPEYNRPELMARRKYAEVTKERRKRIEHQEEDMFESAFVNVLMRKVRHEIEKEHVRKASYSRDFVRRI